jgi:intracellular multiplication protein IcmD
MKEKTKALLLSAGKAILISSVCACSIELLAAAATEKVGAKPETISGMANNLRNQFSAIADLILATARVAGIGFSLAAIFKFKQHKDNPTQVPIGTPFALLAVGIILMFMKGIFDPAAKSIYGEGADKMDGFEMKVGQK